MPTRLGIGLVVVLFLVAGCGGSDDRDPSEPSWGEGDGPVGTWKAWHAAQVNQDWAALYELLSPSKRAEAEKAWGEGGELRKEAPELAKDLGKSVEAVLGMSVRDLYVTMNEQDVAKMKENAAAFQRRFDEFEAAEFLTEEIDGEGADVKFLVGGRGMSLKLVREGGRWYLNRSPLN